MVSEARRLPDAAYDFSTGKVNTAERATTTINNIDTYPKMAIIMGNEGNGMHEEILSLCDIVAYIPIKTMESLNVAVAAGIMMYTYGG